jgi:membrane associated rhomboid family serine protease
MESVRQTSDPVRASDWALVLAAAGLPHELRENDGELTLWVEGSEALAAARALDAYDAESRVADSERVVPPVVEAPSQLGWAVALVLAAFYLAAGSYDVPGEPSRWFRLGSASAELILHGQWWRAVTALTLHADLLHLFGNAVAALIFVTAVGRWLGPGLGATLILLAGAGGNLLTAVAHGIGHVSVGASTATFAALGLLVGRAAARRSRQPPLRRKAWVPIGAGLGIFAMLGVGERSDVLAHLFGLAAGGVLGGLAAHLLAQGRRPGRLAQSALALAAAAALASCWLLAFGRL